MKILSQDEMKQQIFEREAGYLFAKATATCRNSMIKFPQPNYVAAKLAEECGEVIRAYIHRAEGRGTTAAFESECVQLIGLVLRLFHEGDQTIDNNAAEVPQ